MVWIASRGIKVKPITLKTIIIVVEESLFDKFLITIHLSDV